MVSNLRLPLLLLSFTVLLVQACLQWQQGPSALAVTITLAASLAAVMIWQLGRVQQRHAALVLKALINQDTSLTLVGQPQLSALLADAQQQLSRSRQ